LLGPLPFPNMRHMPHLSCYAKIQFDGTRFSGWQRQKTDRTVQGEIERVLEQLTTLQTPVVAAGRTDAGVHALAQCVSFRVPDHWTVGELQHALNSLLPNDIWIETVGEVSPDFNARRSATSRRYRYIIGLDAAAHSPFRRGREWTLNAQIDRTELQACAKSFLGKHDFRAFSALDSTKPHFQCTIQDATWHERPEKKGIIFEVEADRFLHHMVRFMVGTMVDVGRGRRPIDDIETLLNEADNSNASPPAPPQGLYLIGVSYPQLTVTADR